MFNKTTITRWALAGGLWFVFSPAPARCDTFTPISSPNASYTSSTTLLQVLDPLQSIVTSESQGGFSMSFRAAGQSVPMDINLVSDAWLSWGPPPQTEGATPIVVRPDDTTVKDVVFSFNKLLTAFGMEVEPDDTTTTAHTITATFNLAGKPVGSIQRSVLGYAGAVLFAGSGTMFDSVEITSDIDFAAGRFRYVLAPAPALTITKQHTGTFSQGLQNAIYTLTVSNAAGASPASGTVTVTEAPPAGLSVVSMTGTGWTCPAAGNTCTRSDALAGGSSYASITVTANVSGSAAATVINSATVSGGGSASNTANDPATVNPITDISSQVSVTQTGFGRNRATGVWSATMTVTNTSGAAISGPIQVVLTALPAGVTMVNNTGTRNGNPYITVSAGALAPGATVSVTIQFMNPSNGFITYTPVTDSGTF